MLEKTKVCVCVWIRKHYFVALSLFGGALIVGGLGLVGQAESLIYIFVLSVI